MADVTKKEEEAQAQRGPCIPVCGLATSTYTDKLDGNERCDLCGHIAERNESDEMSVLRSTCGELEAALSDLRSREIQLVQERDEALRAADQITAIRNAELQMWVTANQSLRSREVRWKELGAQIEREARDILEHGVKGGPSLHIQQWADRLADLLAVEAADGK